jgi:hypothetical protein
MFSEFIFKRVRLTYFFLIFLIIYTFVSLLIPVQKFEAGALTLFSVNSFLYGFYIAPILGAQKTRIDELSQTIRSEANSLFAIGLKLKKISDPETRKDLRKLLEDYIKISVKERKIAQGEKQYEDLISYCMEYKGKDIEVIEKILNDLIDNQKNRTKFSMLVGNKVFSNEWLIMLVLFSITMGFVLMIDINDNFLLIIVKALLCTGLSMLLFILAKLSTLTHKKAKQVWDPLIKLRTSNFYRID